MSPELVVLRQLVNEKWNCDDILFNFVVAQDGGRTVYRRAASLVDLSSTTGVGISHDETAFIQKAEQCIRIFREHFGRTHLRAAPFDFSVDPPPLCDESVSQLFCSY